MPTARTLLALASLAVATAACGSDAPFIRANGELLDELPSFPGAEQVERDSAPYYPESDVNPDPIGYTTSVVFAVPEGTTGEAVVTFYAEGLDTGWACHREDSPVMNTASDTPTAVIPMLICARGEAMLAINTDGIVIPAGAAGPTFEVDVDAHHREE